MIRKLNGCSNNNNNNNNNNYNNKYIDYRGGSAAQSSLIQLIDIIFEVKHKEKSVVNFLKEMHNYMPLQHKQFLQEMEKNFSKYSLKKNIVIIIITKI